MTTDQLEDLVRDALAWRADHTAVDADACFDGRSGAADNPAGNPVRVWVAAAAVVALAFAGLVALQARDDSDRTVSQPPDRTTTSVPRTTQPTEPQLSEQQIYTVVSGDFLAAIAQEHCVTPDAIAELNGWEDGVNHPLYVGDELLIPPDGCAGDGRVGLGPDAGLVVASAEELDASTTFAQSYPTRVYATDAARPEDRPALVVTATPVAEDGSEPPTPDGAIEVAVGDGEGTLFENPGGSLGLWFTDDGYDFQLEAFNLDNAELIAAAESAVASPDGNGAVIDLTVLPAGVAEQMSEQFVGWRESVFVSAEASSQTAPLVTFADPADDRAVTYLSFADTDLARISRLGFAEITETTVDGAPGYIGTFANPEFSSLVWTTESRTMFMTGPGFSGDELLAIAESLRPVSESEWEDMVAVNAAVPAAQTTTSRPR